MLDISARLRLPEVLMALAMPYGMVVDFVNEMDHSFILQ
jgi:hypothetical protein